MATERVPIEYQPSDPQLLRHAFWQGMEAHNMRLVKWTPEAKHYRDEKSGKCVAVIQKLPELDEENNLIDPRWCAQADTYVCGKNKFAVTVAGRAVELLARGERATWEPEVYLNKNPIPCSGPRLLPVDPLNPLRQNNTLEAFAEDG